MQQNLPEAFPFCTRCNNDAGKTIRPFGRATFLTISIK